MNKRTITAVIITSGMLVIVAAAFASSSPDGLDWVARGLGFAQGSESGLAPFPSYAVPALGHSFLSTLITGLIGIASVFIVVYLAGKFILGLRDRPKKSFSVHRQ